MSLLVSVSAQSFAQTFGIAAGGNYSTINFSGADADDDFLDGYRSILGFNVGGFYDLNFNDNMGMRFGLKYTGKGYGYKDDFSNSYTVGNVTYTEAYSTEASARLNYIQVNPMFKYKMAFGSDNAFYAMVGPYISVGVSGRQQGESSYTYSDGTTTIIDSDSFDEKIEFGDNGDGIDLLDFGFTPAVGVELNKIFLEASYDFGVNNIDTYNDPDFRVSNRNFSVTVGYLFGK